MKLNRGAKTGRRAFTLVELIVTIAVLAILSGVAFYTVAFVPARSAEQTLKANVSTINSAIQVYRVSGGSLDGVTSPVRVLAKLKTIADEVSAKQVAGFTGQKLDARMIAVMQTAAEAATDAPRALWIPSKQRFAVAYSGAVGVKRFELSEEAAAAPRETETITPTMKLASNDKWIWDYTETTGTGSASPTPVTTWVGGSGGGPPPGSTPVPPGTPVTLNAPSFSIPGGNYPIEDYFLTLQLLDPNPPFSSRVLYRVNGGPWEVYGGGDLLVTPNTLIVARAEPLSPLYTDSDVVMTEYGAKPSKLADPIVTASAERFDLLGEPTVAIRIDNPNDAAISKLQFRINNGAWYDYISEIVLETAEYEMGAKVRARAVPTAEYWVRSNVVDKLVGRAMPLLAGTSDGWFSDPIGSSGLVTNLGPGETNQYFSWGRSYYSSRPPSWMEIHPHDFSNVKPDERFSLGSLDYYNGTIYGGTGANSVKLNVEIVLEGGDTLTFQHTLEMINTPNSGVSQEEAADIVHLATLASNSTAKIDGLDYYLVLEFGETGDNGFASVDKFHVFENEQSRGNLYATLILASDLDVDDPYYFGEDEEVDPDDIIVEEEYAPLLLAIDSTTISSRRTSIKEIAEAHDVDKKWLINEDRPTYSGNPWLRWSEEFAGDEVLLPSGTLTNAGIFQLPGDGPFTAEEFALGTVPWINLWKVEGVDPLGPDGVSMLYGRTIVAVVYDDAIKQKRNHGVTTTQLSKRRLGRIAFTVMGVEAPGGLEESRKKGGSMWDLRIRIESPIETDVFDLDPFGEPTLISDPLFL